MTPSNPNFAPRPRKLKFEFSIFAFRNKYPQTAFAQKVWIPFSSAQHSSTELAGVKRQMSTDNFLNHHRRKQQQQKQRRRIPKVFTSSHDEYDDANLASGAVDGILVLPPPGAEPLYLVANMEDHGDPEALAEVLAAHSRKEGRGVVNV